MMAKTAVMAWIIGTKRSMMAVGRLGYCSEEVRLRR
jgi:hypothetical protein